MCVYNHHHLLLLLDRRLAGSQNTTGLTDQTLLTHCSEKKNVLQLSALKYIQQGGD
jgi:hypothetical protein